MLHSVYAAASLGISVRDEEVQCLGGSPLSPLCVQHDFLQIKGTCIILEWGTSPPGCVEAVSEVRRAPERCLYHFARFHIITSSSEIAGARAHRVCRSRLAG